ncbi:glycosyl transferase family 2 [Dulcicalothrix desertica PCC 7102]|uniref:Glycosyl transferase family 2 n=1 Tax=Dulcicalothrix desertica PCC 7102 TaxID=232991 RepID=A0A433UN35_9CYAN|nr:glycosyltransferase [Dulcicalothrix desertica]RUS95242.1 glycosyl transferase family 2 [Dulcicalothrix desertica PCC 7102]TWH40672.1 hypothetical protein CAL7102_10020 [Dulcicalothrix desertica PCC 7102]
MEDKAILSVSLVVYKNNPELLRKVISSIFETPFKIHMTVVDNSPTSQLSTLFSGVKNIDYLYNDSNNYGFGKAHNIAINHFNARYHLVVNPDVYFNANVIPELIKYLESNQDIGLISPIIYYPNGEIQYLCKRYPSIFLLFARRFIPKKLQILFQKHLDWYEMRDIGYGNVMDVPYLSGCFMLFRRKYLDEIGYFDENIFMYLEDADITLRMSRKYRTVFYPHVHIFHHWGKGSYKSFKLMMINIQSAIYFFNKHGWFLF